MRRQCQVPDCTERAGPNIIYCAKHMNTVRKCVIDGCENTVAVWSRSGCCIKSHRAESFKLRP